MLHTETQMSIPPQYEQACSALGTVAAGGSCLEETPPAQGAKHTGYTPRAIISSTARRRCCSVTLPSHEAHALNMHCASAEPSSPDNLKSNLQQQGPKFVSQKTVKDILRHMSRLIACVSATGPSRSGK